MIIRTVKQHGDFAVLPKLALNDDRLSWEARGVLAYLLEKPDGWQVYQSDLVKRGPAQDHKVRRIMAELEGAGYVKRQRINGDGGKWTWITEIYETPQPVVPPSSDNRYMVDESAQPSRDYPRVDYPRVEEPISVYPRVENHPISKQQQNQEQQNQEQQNQEQQQQHASPVEPDPVSGHAAAADLLTPEQRTALALLGVAAPAFTAPETFVRRYDPRLIGYWCIAVEAMTGSELEAIKSIPAFLYAMVKKGDWPALSGRQTEFWKGLLANRQRDDEPEELDF